SGRRLLAPREQRVVRRAPEAALRLSDPVEFGLELFEPARLRFERSEEGVEVGGRLAQAELDVAQLVAGTLQLRSEPLEGRDRALGERDEASSAFALVRGERRGGGGRSGGELDDVTVPLALGPQRVLLRGLHAV